MKSYIRILAILLIASIKSSAQLIDNGDFAVNGGNLLLDCNGQWGSGAPTVYNVRNWSYSHGTPNFCNYCTSPSSIYMADWAGKGEGIVGGYHFKAGVTYIIHLGIVSLSNPNSVVMKVGSGAKPISSDCYSLCTNPNEKEGIAPTGSNEQIILSPNAGIGLSTLNIGDNTFYYTPSSDRDWVMLYPLSQGSESNCEFNDLTVKYIYINSQCRNKYIDVFQNNGQYYGKEPYYCYGYSNIYVGSKYGTFSLASTNTQNSVLQASGAIYLDENFLATADGGTSFTAYIDKSNQCEYFPDEVYGGWSALEDKGSISFSNSRNAYNMQQGFSTTSVSNITEQVTNITISPNPNNGNFEIRFPHKGKYNIQINNLLGATVYSSNSIEIETKITINNQNSLSPGTYTVHITGNDVNFVQKLIITK